MWGWQFEGVRNVQDLNAKSADVCVCVRIRFFASCCSLRGSGSLPLSVSVCFSLCLPPSLRLFCRSCISLCFLLPPSAVSLCFSTYVHVWMYICTQRHAHSGRASKCGEPSSRKVQHVRIKMGSSCEGHVKPRVHVVEALLHKRCWRRGGVNVDFRTYPCSHKEMLRCMNTEHWLILCK